MDYRSALAYLDEHVDLERSAAVAGRVEGLTTEPVRRLLGLLGDPQHAYPVVHVTGTNGKGSVARMIAALLAGHGLSVGTFTSPHLERVNERLQRNLVPIDDEAFGELIGELAGVAPLAGVTPSYFELLTAAALWWFADQAVDVAVVEVGMLGRYDATNVVEADVAVVTNVGRDHTDGVGDWRADVAREKAGIIEPDSFVVLGEPDPDLRRWFEQEPSRGMWVLGEDFEVDEDVAAVGGRLARLRTPMGVVDDVFVPAHGRHQVLNAAVALAAVEAFFGRAVDAGIVREAFAGLTLPGRFEIVGRAPLVVLDGAHNPPGALAAAETFHEDLSVPGRRFVVLGMLAGRDVGLFVESLDVAATDLVLVCAPASPRALPVHDLADAVRAAGAEVEVAGGVPDAVARALAVATEDDAVLVTGSLYTVGEARSSLRGARGR